MNGIRGIFHMKTSRKWCDKCSVSLSSSLGDYEICEKDVYVDSPVSPCFRLLMIKQDFTVAVLTSVSVAEGRDG